MLETDGAAMADVTLVNIGFDRVFADEVDDYPFRHARCSPQRVG